METAALLDLPDARWYAEPNARERDWGAWDLATPGDKSPREESRRARGGLYFAPQGGESLAAVVLRVDLILNYLNSRYPNKRVLMVCHGERHRGNDIMIFWPPRFLDTCSSPRCASRGVVLPRRASRGSPPSGELMWAFRIRFEKINQMQYRDMADAARGKERIHNCSILRYSRRDPETDDARPGAGVKASTL